MAAPLETVAIKARESPSQRSVLIINTGGTIGMSADAGGALRCREGYLLEKLASMAEFQRPEMPCCSLYELLPLLDSSDMCPDDWARIARVIEASYWEHDGFVVVMGTDTMAYAAAALSFMLESLGKPVIFTGSMLPLGDLVNDAHRNLIVSVVIAGMLDVPEVCVFMDARLLRGNRTVKTSTEGLDSFDSPNCPPLATLETGIRLRTSLVLPPPKGRFTVHTAMEKNIAVWRMIPGFSDEYIEITIEHSKHLRAIVLELYGTGNLSTRKQSLVDALKRAQERGVVIVAVSQCLRGRVDMAAYALGRQFLDIGVIGVHDCTTEAVVGKLSFLLSWPEAGREQLRHYMCQSLRGELTPPANPHHGTSAGAWEARVVEGGDVYFSGLGRVLGGGGEGGGGGGGGGGAVSPSPPSRLPAARSAAAALLPALPSPSPPPRGLRNLPSPPPAPRGGAGASASASASSEAAPGSSAAAAGEQGSSAGSGGGSAAAASGEAAAVRPVPPPPRPSAASAGSGSGEASARAAGGAGAPTPPPPRPPAAAQLPATPTPTPPPPRRPAPAPASAAEGSP